MGRLLLPRVSPRRGSKGGNAGIGPTARSCAPASRVGPLGRRPSPLSQRPPTPSTRREEHVEKPPPVQRRSRSLQSVPAQSSPRGRLPRLRAAATLPAEVTAPEAGRGSGRPRGRCRDGSAAAGARRAALRAAAGQERPLRVGSRRAGDRPRGGAGARRGAVGMAGRAGRALSRRRRPRRRAARGSRGSWLRPPDPERSLRPRAVPAPPPRPPGALPAPSRHPVVRQG